MHIAEGLLPAEWAAAWAVAATPFVVKGVLEVKKRTTPSTERDDEGNVVRVQSRRETGFLKPFLGIFAAAVFIISLLPIPVPMAGTSSHMGGTPLAAILLGPFIGTVLGSIAMFFQALFFAHGGLTTLGANVMAEGVAASFTAVTVFWAGRKLGLRLPIAAGLAGVMGDLAIYLVSSGELALALHGVKPLLAVWGTYLLAYMPTQAPLAVVEGLLTGGVVHYLLQNRPDILHKLRVIGPDHPALEQTMAQRGVS